MICPSCGTHNEEGRKFCGECATRLVVSCPNCGTVNAPAAKFCGECAAPLRAEATSAGLASAAPSAPAAAGSGGQASSERRLVSVLFADLVGFTPFAEERDAEEVRDTLSRYFEIATDVIGRYGGTIEKFIGDAVMAVWGTPTAREDDAERAVRAGLELVVAVRALGEGIHARAGVLTGEAAVTVGATNQGMVAGDLVNTAARLQSVAPADGVLVGEATRLAASRAVVFEEAGEQQLKGKQAPVPAWRAVRVVAERGGRNRSEALEAPFVGREEELRLLKDLFHSTAREERLRLVSIMGPAGIGKSRIAWEFLKYIDGLVQAVWWHDGRSPAYGEGISFWALGEMVRARCGLVESDDEQTTRAKVAAIVEEHVPNPAERTWIGNALLALLGVETGTGREQLFAAWRTFFERLAASAPVVLVFEDLHFADSGLLDFIDHLLDWSRGVPIYVVTLSRPELLDRRTSWGAAKRNFISLTLEPLSPRLMRELLAGLVPGLPERAIETIVGRADGIPLYAVETVRMLMAQGRLRAEAGAYVPADDLADLSVPGTLTALIASRLDALPPADRSLLQDASVLGQSFTPAGLAAVSGIDVDEVGAHLRPLVQRELLRLEADARSPEQGQYVFVQALIREVAYNTLARRDRKTRHLAAARFFEALGSDELAGALAAQYVAARQNAGEGPEADALAGQARIALKAAAERAIGLGSLGQAVTFFDQARELATSEAEQTDLLERAGSAATESGLAELAEQRLREAVERRRATDDRQGLARASALLGHLLTSTLRTDESAEMLAGVVDELIGDSSPADPDRVALLAQFARARYIAQQLPEALLLADRALEAAERLDLVAVVADLLVTRGMSLVLLGRSYEGTGAMKTGAQLAEANALLGTLIRAQLNLGVAQHDTDPRAAFEMARSAMALAARLGRGGLQVTLLGNLVGAGADLGEWDLAWNEAMRIRETVVDEFGRHYVDWTLIGIAAFRGEADPEDVVRLITWAGGLEDAKSRAGVHELRASVAFGLGHFAEAAREWALFAPIQLLNAAQAWYYSSISALAAGDMEAARTAVSAHEALAVHGGLISTDRRLLRAGLDLLTGEETDTAVRELVEVAGSYAEAGLPWRTALVALVAAATGDPARAGVRRLIDDGVEVMRALRAPRLADATLELSSSGGAPRTSKPVAAKVAVEAH